MKSVSQKTLLVAARKPVSRTAGGLARSCTQINVGRDETPVDATKVAAGLLFGTSLLASEPVMAAQEIATVAADNRLGAVAFIFVPAVAWVLFNILGPASRQLDKMQSEKPKSPPKPKPVARSVPAKAARPVKKAAPPPKKAVAKRR